MESELLVAVLPIKQSSTSKNIKDLYSLRTNVKRLCNDGTSALVQRAVSFAEIMLVFNFTSGLPAAGRDIPRFLVYLTPCHGMS